MIYFTIRHRPNRGGHDKVLVYAGGNPGSLALAGELTLRREEAHGLWRLLGGVHEVSPTLMNIRPFEDIQIEVPQG